MAKPFSNAIAVAKKYTQEPTGVWSTIARIFATDPNRSSGIPIKHFRTPTPGSLAPQEYDDPVTIPAGDMADNPYWKRDMRRSYPKLSTITQGDAVALLTVGNAANPAPTLQAGAQGTQQLVVAQEEGEKGLAAYLEKETGTSILAADGMPRLPPSFKSSKVVDYKLEADQSYDNQYPCRSFS